MEDVLAVYTRPHNADYPLVCLDETSKQLIAETRTPIPMKRGRAARIDYEYERNGTANLFMLFAPLEGWRHVEVTDHHTAVDYAHVLKDLADRHFPHAKTIVLVQDNLNIHSKARTRCPLRSVSRSPHPRQTDPHRGNRRLGTRPKCQSHKGRLAIHNPIRSSQTQVPIPFDLAKSAD